MNRHGVALLRRAIAALPAMPTLARKSLANATMLVPGHNPANNMRHTRLPLATVQSLSVYPDDRSRHPGISRKPKNP